MICDSCKNEFDNINGLRFCPYCGRRLEDMASAKTEQINEDGETKKVEDIITGNKLHDTLKMPAITKEDIERYKNETQPSSKVKPFKNMKIVISAATAILIIALGVFGYLFFSNRTVDEAKIKQDLVGKTIVLPKGTSVEIKKG